MRDLSRSPTQQQVIIPLLPGLNWGISAHSHPAANTNSHFSLISAAHPPMLPLLPLLPAGEGGSSPSSLSSPHQLSPGCVPVWPVGIHDVPSAPLGKPLFSLFGTPRICTDFCQKIWDPQLISSGGGGGGGGGGVHDVPSSPLEVCFFHFRVPQDFFQICIKKFWSTPRFFKKIIFEEKNWVTPRFLSNFIFFQIFVKKLDFSKKYSGGIPKFFDKNLKFFLGQPNFIFRKIKIFDKNLKKYQFI